MKTGFRLTNALILSLLVLAAPAFAKPQAEEPWRYDDVPRIIAIGDVHGAYEQLVEVLRAASLIDETGTWSGGDTHLVMLGDLLDRGPDEKKVLDLIMKLEPEAVAAGGKVHVLLGNHEVMNLVGDLRYVAKTGYQAFAEVNPPPERDKALARFMRDGSGAESSPDGVLLQFNANYPPGYFSRRAAFAPDGKYGKWLLTKPFILVINGIAFVHGGLPPILSQTGPEELNKQLKKEILDYLSARKTLIAFGFLFPETSFVESFQLAGQKLEEARARGNGSVTAASTAAVETLLDSAGALAFRTDNPFWYRGSSLNPEAEEAPVFDAALAKLGATAVVVGHTVTPGNRISTRFGGRLYRVDTGMLSTVYRGKPAALEFKDGNVRTIYPDQPEVTAPVPEKPPSAVTEVAERISDAEIEEFLSTAEVLKFEDIGSGITRPQRVTLRKDGTVRRAAVKTVDEQEDKKVRIGNRYEMTFSDRYVHEIAAYKLDRLLGLDMVPVVVGRTLNGKPGALIDWVENAIDEGRRLQENLEPYDPARVNDQKNLMHLFDILIYNTDRNQGNMLYTPGDWKLHLIDHTRAFRLNTGRPPGLEGYAIEIPKEFRERLAALTQEQVEQATKGLLSRAQAHAIIKRRDQLLAEVDAR